MEITSNIWGTKFKIHGLATYLPPDLGQVVYKTSLLHLQPRQMTVTITELSPDMQLIPHDVSFSPHSFSEDDDENSTSRIVSKCSEKSPHEIPSCRWEQGLGSNQASRNCDRLISTLTVQSHIPVSGGVAFRTDISVWGTVTQVGHNE